MARDLKAAVFLDAINPGGSRPGFGRLPCPHCGDLHVNPTDGSSLWTRPQVIALAAMKASRLCAGCGKPSVVAVGED